MIKVFYGAHFLAPFQVLYRCGDYPLVPLFFPLGCISYAPAMVRRQIGSKQFIPMTHGLSRLEFSSGAVERVKEVAKAWKQTHRIASGNYTGGTNEEYPTWHDRRRKGFRAPYMARTCQYG